MKVTIGRRLQIGTAQLYLRQGENAWLEFKVGEETIRLNLRLVAKGEGAGMTKIFGEEDYGVLEISDSKGTLGSGSGDAYLFMGDHGGFNAYVTFYSTPLGDTNFIQLQFYREE
jgi:hypothetical protein